MLPFGRPGTVAVTCAVVATFLLTGGIPLASGAFGGPGRMPAVELRSVGSRTATLNLSSSVRCAGPPWVEGYPAGPSLILPEPGRYAVNVTEFCGTSAFYNWSATGGVELFAESPGYNSTYFGINRNGTVEAHYVTEPAGLYPVVFLLGISPAEWDKNWTVYVGPWSASTNKTCLIVGVSNGTYNVTTWTVGGETGPIWSGNYTVHVDGAGVLVKIPPIFADMPLPLPPIPTQAPGASSIWSYSVLIAYLVGVAAGLAVTCWWFARSLRPGRPPSATPPARPETVHEERR